jgi:hypothetical protein
MTPTEYENLLEMAGFTHIEGSMKLQPGCLPKSSYRRRAQNGEEEVVTLVFLPPENSGRRFSKQEREATLNLTDVLNKQAVNVLDDGFLAAMELCD